jgi:hypothetical protein
MYDYVDAQYPVGGEGCRMSVCERRCTIVLQRLQTAQKESAQLPPFFPPPHTWETETKKV